MWLPALREHLYHHWFPVLYQSRSLPGCGPSFKVTRMQHQIETGGTLHTFLWFPLQCHFNTDISNSQEQSKNANKQGKWEETAYLMLISCSSLTCHVSRFTSLRSMNAAWFASAIVWMKEIPVGVAFFQHKELSKDRKNQSVCFEHYPMQKWEHWINYYRFSVGFMFPLAILSVW